MTYPAGTGGGFDARALWRQQRDRWHHLPERTRRIVVLVVQAVIVLGDPTKVAAPLVRLHSSCFTGDILESLRCDCGSPPQ